MGLFQDIAIRFSAGRLAASLAAVLLAGCTPPPLGTALPHVWQPSPNHNARRANFVILHHTSNTDAATALRTLGDPLRKVSAHYLVGRDGTIYQLVDERERAWHAGASRWGMLTDLNSGSIGIEMDNSGSEAYPEVQVGAVLALLADIRTRNRIPWQNYLAHGDVAPGRKSDPGILFPWKRLADAGFGLWCPTPRPAAPANFDVFAGLAELGYDPDRPQASLEAFRRHFRGLDSDAPAGPEDAALLECLLRTRIGKRAEPGPSGEIGGEDAAPPQ